MSFDCQYLFEDRLCDYLVVNSVEKVEKNSAIQNRRESRNYVKVNLTQF